MEIQFVTKHLSTTISQTVYICTIHRDFQRLLGFNNLQETYHEMRIAERNVTYIVLSVNYAYPQIATETEPHE